MTNKGVISDWPDTIKELWEAIREPHNILKIEKMYRKKWNKINRKQEEVETGNIIITFKGNEIKKTVGLWDNTVSIKLRPYVEPVKQCYKCFRYGHIKAMCKSEERCIICGEKAHGRCEKEEKCRNCHENHRSTFKGCVVFEKNKNIQTIKAYNNVNYNRAVRILEGRETEEEGYNRYEEPEQWPKIPEAKNKKDNIGNYTRMITTQVTRDYAKALSQKKPEPEQEQQQRKDYYQRNMYERKRETMKKSYTPNKNLQEESGKNKHRQYRRMPTNMQSDKEDETEEEVEELEPIKNTKNMERSSTKEEVIELIIKLKKLINGDARIKREILSLLEDTGTINIHKDNISKSNEEETYQREQQWTQVQIENRKRHRENRIVNEIQRKYWRTNQTGYTY
ncbi:hypothetical protein PV328_005788 [Microctonus aethiopoides]|uniref:CCHC-type domain-containing protein n=1 Tax=Microctonus aethiopoides TaxID=144406 RepID=A0AA39FN40_9HYME|nr:hypothetical protein PV328_005788 [Microctonus aethiopoides]